jgi:hypothetical protein
MGEQNRSMCYSAQIWAAWRKFMDFAELYGFRMTDKRVRVPKAMDLGFLDPQTEEERQVKALIDEFNTQQASEWEQELFKQRKRLADADRAL